MRKALRRLLTTHGFSVEDYENGNEFLAALAAHPADCLVLDLHMPEVSGIDVLAAFTERHIATDPPTAVELESLAADIRVLIGRGIPDDIVAEEGIAVAGTPTSLAAIEMRLDPYDPERVHDHELVLPSIQRMLSQLASSPLSDRAQITGLHPDRAPTIVAGVVILIEAMRAFGLSRITVSEHDILYGTAIAAASSDSGSSLLQ